MAVGTIMGMSAGDTPPPTEGVSPLILAASMAAARSIATTLATSLLGIPTPASASPLFMRNTVTRPFLEALQPILAFTLAFAFTLALAFGLAFGIAPSLVSTGVRVGA